MTHEDAAQHTGSWTGVWKSEFPEGTTVSLKVYFPDGSVVTSKYIYVKGVVNANLLERELDKKETLTISGELVERKTGRWD